MEAPSPAPKLALTVRRPWQPWAVVAGAVVVAAGLVGAGFAWGHHSATASAAAAASASAKASAAAADVRLSRAYQNCHGRDTANTVSLGDRGATLVIDTRSEYTSLAGVTCVLAALRTPESITAEIDSTTAMMGSRSAQSDGLSYTWSYHPDNGLNMVITDNK